MILDIAIILLALLVIFIGYKIGFFRCVLNFASIFSGFIIAIFATYPMTKLLFSWGIGSGFSDNFYNKITTSELGAIYTEAGGGQEGIKAALVHLKFPEFLASLMSQKATGDEFETIARAVADGIAKAILGVIVFFTLLIGLTILIWILKKVFKSLRKASTLIRIVDGSLGAALMLILFAGLILVFYTVISYFMESTSGFMTFMRSQLIDDGTVRIGLAKWMYDNNPIAGFVHFIF